MTPNKKTMHKLLPLQTQGRRECFRTAAEKIKELEGTVELVSEIILDKEILLSISAMVET
jgi:hypothetical protein